MNNTFRDNTVKKTILDMIITILLFWSLQTIFNFRPLTATSSLPDVIPLLRSMSSLEGKCFDTIYKLDWWSYVWCYKKEVRQVHLESQAIESENFLGSFIPHESTPVHHVYRGNVADCEKESGEMVIREVSVDIICCGHDIVAGHRRSGRAEAQTQQTFIERYWEQETCSYRLSVCCQLICASQFEKSQTGVHDDTVATAVFDTNSIFGPTRGGDKHHHQHPPTPASSEDLVSTQNSSRDVSPQQQLEYLERVRVLFTHGYDSYMKHALPAGELKPVSCSGGQFDLIKIPLVTLIDSLDMLVIMGNFSEFRHAVRVVESEFPDYFNLDVNVSLFETTIRILGGLLSAHLLATDPALGIYRSVRESYVMPPSPVLTRNETWLNYGEPMQQRPHGENVDSRIHFAWNQHKHESHFDSLSSSNPHYSDNEEEEPAASNSFENTDNYEYNNILLTLSIDLAERLMPAFNTLTWIPYGTVNLRYGVPEGETEIASTAGAGSLVVEFESLSRVTGIQKYGQAARLAAKAIYNRKSVIGLVGKHINTSSGKWVEVASGVGSNSDSFYEYLLKYSLLFQYDKAFEMFSTTYHAVKEHVQIGDWFSDVDMFTGKGRRNRVESLHGFWPGMESTIGYTESSTQLLNALYGVWSDLGFLPEEFDQTLWFSGKGPIGNPYYPLRPELIESTYHHYRVTGDRTWLHAAALFLESLEDKTRTECGHASVRNVRTGELEDNMPSFFLSETCKYLYLLFDEENFVHHRPYIFSTEAHLFDPLQLFERKSLVNATNLRINPSPTQVDPSTSARKKESEEIELRDGENDSPADEEEEDEEEEDEDDDDEILGEDFIYSSRLLMGRCPKRLYWDSDVGFNPQYFSSQGLGMDLPPLTRLYNAQAHLQTTSEAGVAKFSLNKLARLVERIDVLMSERDGLSMSRTGAAAIFRDELIGQGKTTTLVENNGVDDAAHGHQKRSVVSQQLYGGPSRPRREYTCYPGEEPPPTSSKILGNAGATPQQTVQISIGALGEFIVDIFADGFIINSLKYEDTLEIANVGSSLVLAQSKTEISLDSNENAKKVLSKSIIGDSRGFSYACSVSLVNSIGELIDFPYYDVIDPALALSPAAKPFSWEGPWKQACSLSTFGPILQSPLVGRIQIPSKEEAEVCKRHSTSSVGGTPSTSWWPFNSMKQDHEQQDSRETANDSPLGTILLAKRGGCLFEEKTETAQQMGYEGIIIENTEETIFLMSGKKETEAVNLAAQKIPSELLDAVTSSTSSSSGTNAVGEAMGKLQQLLRKHLTMGQPKAAASIRIPTAMISQDHGHQLKSLAAKHFQETGSEVFVQMQTETRASILNSAFLGYEEDYPSIRMFPQRIQIAGESEWGAILSSSNGQEWQLYIIAKADFSHATAWGIEALNNQNQPISTSESFSFNPVEAYANLIARKCPSFVNYDGAKLKIMY